MVYVRCGHLSHALHGFSVSACNNKCTQLTVRTDCGYAQRIHTYSTSANIYTLVQDVRNTSSLSKRRTKLGKAMHLWRGSYSQYKVIHSSLREFQENNAHYSLFCSIQHPTYQHVLTKLDEAETGFSNLASKKHHNSTLLATAASASLLQLTRISCPAHPPALLAPPSLGSPSALPRLASQTDCPRHSFFCRPCLPRSLCPAAFDTSNPSHHPCWTSSRLSPYQHLPLASLCSTVEACGRGVAWTMQQQRVRVFENDFFRAIFKFLQGVPQICRVALYRPMSPWANVFSQTRLS